MCSSGVGGQSVILPAGTSGAVPFPRVGTAPVRIEIRVHNRTPVHKPNQGHIIQLPAGTYIANAYIGDTSLVCSSDISVAAYVYNLPQDFTVRFQRNPEKRLLSCEVWNTETGARIGGSTTTIHRTVPMESGTATLGGRYSDSQIDFLSVP